MVTFEVNDMTCRHCIDTITKVVWSVDRGAKVEVDLATHRVHIEPTEAEAQELSDAITEAGYTPIPVQAAAVSLVAAAPRGGCCCGS